MNPITISEAHSALKDATEAYMSGDVCAMLDIVAWSGILSDLMKESK